MAAGGWSTAGCKSAARSQGGSGPSRSATSSSNQMWMAEKAAADARDPIAAWCPNRSEYGRRPGSSEATQGAVIQESMSERALS